MSNETSAHGLHAQLGRLNSLRFYPSFRSDNARALLEEETALRRLEIDFVDAERQKVHARASQAPSDVAGFMAWFRNLETAGPGQQDPLFPWLENHASFADMAWFLSQEAAGEAGFDDLVAFAQLKMPHRAKLEMARNYWDEMGRGHAEKMHGAMLDEMLEVLGISPAGPDAVWQTQALGNMMCALAGNRAYAYQAIGALGAIELTAPRRAAAVNAGLKRLGAPVTGRRYYAIHATLDIQHAEAWMDEVFAPLLAADPRVALPLAEGALLRMHAGEQVFQTYRAHLWRESAVALAC